VVGGSYVNDLYGAESAGMQAVLINREGKVEAKRRRAIAMVRSLEELLNLLHAMQDWDSG